MNRRILKRQKYRKGKLKKDVISDYKYHEARIINKGGNNTVSDEGQSRCIGLEMRQKLGACNKKYL